MVAGGSAPRQADSAGTMDRVHVHLARPTPAGWPMSRRILIQVTAPAVLIGLILLGASLASVWSINRLQRNLAGILTGNVASLEAAQELEIKLRQLRFHSFVY